MALLLPYLAGVLVPFLLVFLVPRVNLWGVLLLGLIAVGGWWAYLVTQNDSRSEKWTSADILILLGLLLIIWAAGMVLGRQVRRAKADGE